MSWLCLFTYILTLDSSCQPSSMGTVESRSLSKVISSLWVDVGFIHKVLLGYYLIIPKESGILSFPLLTGSLLFQKSTLKFLYRNSPMYIWGMGQCLEWCHHTRWKPVAWSTVAIVNTKCDIVHHTSLSLLLYRYIQSKFFILLKKI